MPHSDFTALLQSQIGNEFTASQQYLAAATWLDGRDLPQLATHFYRQSLEERNHALMMVRYMLDRDLPVIVPAVGAVRNEFTGPREPIAMALDQEQGATEQIEALFRAARKHDDVLGEQFMLWFLKEQVEEVASMTTLLAIADRAGDRLVQDRGVHGPGADRRDRRRPLGAADRRRLTVPASSIPAPPRR